MTQVENEELVRYEKSNKYYDFQEKVLWTYKDKENIEDKNRILSTFANEKYYVNAELEINCEFGIIITFKAKKKKNTEGRKMNVFTSTLLRNEKEDF